MGLKWRLGLVAVLAAAVLGGLVPHAVVTGTESAGTAMVQAVQSPLAVQTMCDDATCGKGTPTPAAPSPAVVLAALLGGLAVVALATGVLRRGAQWMGALPRGRHDPLEHPPKFS